MYRICRSIHGRGSNMYACNIEIYTLQIVYTLRQLLFLKMKISSDYLWSSINYYMLCFLLPTILFYFRIDVTEAQFLQISMLLITGFLGLEFWFQEVCGVCVCVCSGQ